MVSSPDCSRIVPADVRVTTALFLIESFIESDLEDRLDDCIGNLALLETSVAEAKKRSDEQRIRS
jgi:hypothetical protein